MDVHATGGDDRTLRRIIALLVALSVLAGRAGARSLPVRCFVLWLLRRAETVATAFVLETTGQPPDFAGITAIGEDPADATHLAAHFQALAAALGALLGPSLPSRRGSACIGRAPRRSASRPDPLLLGGETPGPYDTS